MKKATILSLNKRGFKHAAWTFKGTFYGFVLCSKKSRFESLYYMKPKLVNEVIDCLARFDVNVSEKRTLLIT